MPRFSPGHCLGEARYLPLNTPALASACFVEAWPLTNGTLPSTPCFAAPAAAAYRGCHIDAAAALIALAADVLLADLAAAQFHLALLAADLAAGELGLAADLQRHAVLTGNRRLLADRVVVHHLGIDLELPRRPAGPVMLSFTAPPTVRAPRSHSGP